MGQYIVKLDGKYLLWSTIVDAPTTYGMTRPELEDYIRFREGQNGLDRLPARIARADEKGTSSMLEESAEETIWLNRAGKGETCLSRAQIVAVYAHGDEDTVVPAGVKIDERFSFEDWVALDKESTEPKGNDQ